MQELCHKSSLKSIQRKKTDSLKIIGQSLDIPRHVVVLSENIPENIAKHIKDTLFKMHEDPEGKKILLAFEKTSKFDEVPNEMLEAVKNMRTYVISILEN